MSKAPGSSLRVWVAISAVLLVGACAHMNPPSPSPSPTAGPEFHPYGETQEATVTDIVDGDTIRVEIGGEEFRVRYIGIDAPEISHDNNPGEPLGEEATRANADMVDGEAVILEKDVSDTDDFGRLLRYVWLAPDTDSGWVMVELELAHEGLADVKRYPPDLYWQEILGQAEASARDNDRGIWAN